VRILSLLPAATEMVYLLGLEESLVGVTHECDYPAAAKSKPRVSFSTLPPDATPAEIDRLVSESATRGAPTGLDLQLIGELAPDLVLTQDLCAVCAVPAGHLRAAIETLGIQAEVVSLDPSSLEEVLHDLVRLGSATGTEERARELASELRQQLEAVSQAVAGKDRPRTLALEWCDPPYNAGHWVPQMIALAGGEPLLAAPGVPSTRLGWEEIAAVQAEVVVFMPCGYELADAVAQAKELLTRPELQPCNHIYAAGANSYYSRPGPRLVAGTEALASILHPETMIEAVPGSLSKLA
jgi:iron complex transport system substrate-binding protein